MTRGDLPPALHQQDVAQKAMRELCINKSTNCIKLYTPRYGRQHQTATVWLFWLMELSSRATDWLEIP